MKHFEVIFLLFLLFSCGKDSEYSSLTKEQINNEFLLKSIHPNDPGIEYWEINYLNFLTPETIYFTGNTELKPSLEDRQLNGFFQDCQPLHCAYNIIYFKNDKWQSVTSEQELKKFIGKVDNEYEAFLSAKIDGFSIDSQNKKGNGFLISDKAFFLKVMKYESCPVSKESFLLRLSSEGKILSQKSLGYYYKSTDCIIY